MLENEDPISPPLLTSDPSENLRSWKIWAAYETQRRAVLGTYILDSQIAFLSGSPTIACHLSDPLFQASDESIFHASSLEEWSREIQRHEQEPRRYRDLFNLLFSVHSEWASINMSAFSIIVTLEGIQSLVSKHNQAGGPPFGTPSKINIIQALGLSYGHQICRLPPNSAEKMEVSLRWHTICLDLAVNLALLCGQVCHECEVEQKLFNGRRTSTECIDKAGWPSNMHVRIALLHAISIREIVENLPLNRLHALHVPAAIFGAATVFSGHLICGQAEVRVPLIRNWKHLMEMQRGESDEELIASLNCHFSPGTRDQREYQSHGIGYTLNTLQVIMKSVSLRWGICIEMEQVLDQWVQRAMKGS
jgi:hypothetical protein